MQLNFHAAQKIRDTLAQIYADYDSDFRTAVIIRKKLLHPSDECSLLILRKCPFIS